jgi:glycosyltransferase involved in cell wall biosynthesis
MSEAREAVADSERFASLRVLGFCDHFYPESSGGIERVAYETYRRMLRMGASIEMIVGLPKQRKPFEAPGLQVRQETLFNLSRVVGAQVGLSPRLLLGPTMHGSTNPNVVHANGLHFQASIMAARTARARRLPLVTTSHVADLVFLDQPQRALTDVYERSVGRFILRQSQKVIAVSDAVADRVAELGVPRSSIVVVPNGVDLEQFVARPGDREPRPKIRLLFIGRHIPNKGPMTFLEAIAQIAPERDDFEAVFLSDGPLRPRLEARAREAGLNGKVRFEGHVDDQSLALRQADVVVRPSLTEGMALSVIEAMAAGACVVASDISANRGLIEDGVTGRLVPPANPTALAQVLREILDAPERMRQMAAAAAQAATGYSWDICAERTGDVLLEAAGSV